MHKRTLQAACLCLLALRQLHGAHGHLQEIIIQNFRAKPGTLMVNAPQPSLDELLWTIAVARLIFGPSMSIQVPPNLNAGQLEPLVASFCGALARHPHHIHRYTGGEQA